MIIKMESDSSSSILHAQTQCRSVHARGFTAGKKHCGKSDLGHRTSRPSDRRVVAGRGVVTWCLRTYIGLRPYMVKVYIKERISD